MVHFIGGSFISNSANDMVSGPDFLIPFPFLPCPLHFAPLSVSLFIENERRVFKGIFRTGKDAIRPFITDLPTQLAGNIQNINITFTNAVIWTIAQNSRLF